MKPPLLKAECIWEHCLYASKGYVDYYCNLEGLHHKRIWQFYGCFPFLHINLSLFLADRVRARTASCKSDGIRVSICFPGFGLVRFKCLNVFPCKLCHNFPTRTPRPTPAAPPASFRRQTINEMHQVSNKGKKRAPLLLETSKECSNVIMVMINKAKSAAFVHRN